MLKFKYNKRFLLLKNDIKRFLKYKNKRIEQNPYLIKTIPVFVASITKNASIGSR